MTGQVSYTLERDGRRWHVFEGITGTGWYARQALSSPPIMLRAITEAALLIKVAEWQPKLTADGTGRGS